MRWWTRAYFWPFSPEEIDRMEPRRAYRWGVLMAGGGSAVGFLLGLILGVYL